MRLQHDLEINLAGVALALELMDEIDALRERLCRLDTNDDS
jgi:chaperone modulatory protein CbpM